jgi:hypothetical protein
MKATIIIGAENSGITTWSAAGRVILVALASTVSFVSGESHFEVPLFGGANKASAAVELYTILFLARAKN